VEDTVQNFWGRSILVQLSMRALYTKPAALFWARSQKCEKRLLASSCPSVRKEQLGSHWTDFDETCDLSLFSEIGEENSSFIKIREE
jgi:hypothetical protein